MEYKEESEIPVSVVNSQACLFASIDNIPKAREGCMNSPEENLPCNFFNDAQNVISVDIEHASNLRIKLEPEADNFEIENIPLNITKKLETNVLQLENFEKIRSIIVDPSYCKTGFNGYEKIPYEEDKHPSNYNLPLELGRIENKLNIKKEDLEPNENGYEEILYSKAEDQLVKVKNDEDCMYDQSLWGIKHKELNLKQEDLESSETCISPEVVEILKCHKCDYQTFRKSYLNQHVMFKHKNLDDLKALKCDQCDYRTIHKSNFNRHMLRHKNPDEVKVLKCTQCEYQTFRKCHLKQHMFRHKNSDEVKELKCNQCDYQTFRKGDLNKHMFRHKNPDEVKVLKCDQCEYRTSQKGTLNQHILCHMNRERLKVLKCNQCDYQTFRKWDFNRHKLRHKKVLKCHQCDYQAFRKGDLNNHMFKHKNPDEVKILKSNQCEYQTFRKYHLKQHMFRHKNSDKVQL